MTKLMNTTAMIAVAFSLMATSAFAGGCNEGEVCGLDLDVGVNHGSSIDGMGGIDLTHVAVKGGSHKPIHVELPKTVSSAVEISQKNNANINANLDYYSDFSVGDQAANVTAVANNIKVETNADTAAELVQDNSGDVNANANISMPHLNSEKMDVAVTAVANNADFDTNGALIIDSVQNNTGSAVNANADISLWGNWSANTDLNVDVTAVGNNLNAKTDGTLVASAVQENCAEINANANVAVYSMRDPINVTAVGNNINIGRK